MYNLLFEPEVIAAKACYFALIDLSHLPLTARSLALGLSLEEQSPFAKTSYWVSWHEKGIAQVYYWDQSIQTKTRAIPEAVLHSKPSHGLIWIKLNEGGIAQLWYKQKLLYSDYHNQRESVNKHGLLTLSNGLPQQQIIEKIVDSKPSYKDLWHNYKKKCWAIIVSVLILLLALTYSYQIGELLQLKTKQATLAESLQQQTQQVNELLNTQNKLTKIEKYLGIMVSFYKQSSRLSPVLKAYSKIKYIESAAPDWIELEATASTYKMSFRNINSPISEIVEAMSGADITGVRVVQTENNITHISFNQYE